MTEQGIITLVKYCVAIFGGGITIVLSLMNYNKRKIEEAKEGSAGREALRKIDEQMAQMQHEHDEFKKDVFDMMFKSK